MITSDSVGDPLQHTVSVCHSFIYMTFVSLYFPLLGYLFANLRSIDLFSLYLDEIYETWKEKLLSDGVTKLWVRPPGQFFRITTAGHGCVHLHMPQSMQ